MAEDKGQTQAKAAGSGAQAPGASGSGKKRILFIVIGLLLVGGAGGGGFFAAKMMSGKTTPVETDKTAEELAADIESGAGSAETESGGKESEKSEKSEKSEGSKKEEKAQEGGLGKSALSFAMQPITTNLNEESARRGINVAFILEARDAKALAELQENEFRIRNEILILLGSKTQAELRMRDGKELLLEEIKTRANRVVGEGKVKDVWYTDFALF